jgi:predicted metal-dependent hydrolase
MSAPAAPLSLFDDAPVPEPVCAFVHPRSRREITLGDCRIGYELRRTGRRTIGFVVGVEGLAVSAPRWVGTGEIDAALRERGGWIVRKLHEQRERLRRVEAARIEWRDGATIRFLGAPVQLVLGAALATTELVVGDARGAAAAARPHRLQLALPRDAGAVQIREAVQCWLQRQARRIFDERCALYAPRLRVAPRRVSLSSATTRWGSATADGSIRLHWRLVQFSLPVVDYVVVHELAHLREMNHGAGFWELVRAVVPAYEDSRRALRDELLPEFD